MMQDVLTEKILGVCFDVCNELGPGFLESVYQNALLFALRDKGIKAEAQKSINVFYRGNKVGEFFADILFEDQVVIELKVVKVLAPEHLAQVINYLKATGERGLLVNFGRSKLEYRRLRNGLEKIE